ncbi:homeobox protein vent1-like [Phyllobates terribilis]|uniref:homeobox protein vent1-like n=1 Tax=Phyllobates terribilis TaxID=111132 RepID=UPI003CCA7D16
MVRQSFTIDCILTGSEMETLSRKCTSKPHIPCVPQPKPPCKFSEGPSKVKRKDQPESSEDTRTFKNLAEDQHNCLQYAESSTTKLCLSYDLSLGPYGLRATNESVQSLFIVFNAHMDFMKQSYSKLALVAFVKTEQFFSHGTSQNKELVLPCSPDRCVNHLSSMHKVSSTSTPGTGWNTAEDSTPSCSEDEGDQASSHGPGSGLQEDVDHGGTSPRSEIQARLRIAFSSHQLSKLEESFKKQRYLGALERKRLACTLHLTEIQVKTWFQNRRMKLKRQIQENEYPMGKPSFSYPHPLHLPYYPVPQRAINFPFYRPQAHSYQGPRLTYSTTPRLQFPPPVPPQAIMNNTRPELYGPFFNPRYM